MGPFDFSFVLTKADQSERRKMDNTAECSRVSGAFKYGIVVQTCKIMLSLAELLSDRGEGPAQRADGGCDGDENSHHRILI